MAPLFPPAANALLRLSLVAGVVGTVGGVVFLLGWARSPYATGQGSAVAQPVLFDHRHHVRDDGIDCFYCHDAARTSAHAGVPAASVCMSCHNQVWNGSRQLEPVRQSFFADEPIHWERVNRLPDFVYFDHQAHISHNVGCATCHGAVDQMANVYAAAPLTMQWCLDCHRDPAPHLRPQEHITDMSWRPTSSDEGQRIQRDRHISPPTHCTACHR